MPKLPDATALGARPTPRPMGPIQAPDLSAPARATSELGGSLTQFGAILLEKKDQDDTYRAESAYNKASEQSSELLAEAIQIKGEEAVSRPLFKEYRERFEALVKNIEDSLENDQQKKKFTRRAEIAHLSFTNALIKHITNEKSAFQQQTYEGGLDVEKDNAATQWDTSWEIKGSIKRTEELIEREASRLGWPADLKKSVKQEKISDIHEAVIKQAVASQSIEYARGWYAKHKGDIAGTVQTELEVLLRDAGIRETSQKAVDEYVVRGMSETEARAEARKKYTGAERDAVLDRIGNRYAEAAKIKDREQKEASEQAWEIYGQTESFDAIPIEILNRMDGQDRTALRHVAESDVAGKPIKTVPETYEFLRDLAANSPEVFKDMPLTPYKDQLSDSDFQEFVKLQTDPDSLRIVDTLDQIIAEKAADVGIDPNTRKKTGSEGDDARKYYARVRSEQEAYRAINGRWPSAKETIEIADRISTEVVKERWFLKPWTWLGGEDPAALIEIEGVPTDMIDELAQAIEATGQPVTRDNIVNLYNYLQGE